METQDIHNRVNEITNSDAERIIKEAKKEAKGNSDRVLAEKLKVFLDATASLDLVLSVSK